MRILKTQIDGEAARLPAEEVGRAPSRAGAGRPPRTAPGPGKYRTSTGASHARPRMRPVCWCGENDLGPYSEEYRLCDHCSTLVSCVGLTPEEIAVEDDENDFYGKDYWLTHQTEELGHANIVERARIDLHERCLHWLRAFASYRLPPARVLEIGCAHGGFVALLRSVGYDATGLELSPWVVDFARSTFKVPVLLGPVEQQDLRERSLDAIVLNDVVEHLADPFATLECCARLLKDDGLLVVQMPCFDGASYADLVARDDIFLRLMQGKVAEQHLNLFSKGAARLLFERLGFTEVHFERPMFPYDMFCFASRRPLVRQPADDLPDFLGKTATGHVVRALLDLYAQFEHCEADRADRLDMIHVLHASLEVSEADRADRLEQIHELTATIRGLQEARNPLHFLARHAEWMVQRLFRRVKRLLRFGRAFNRPAPPRRDRA